MIYNHIMTPKIGDFSWIVNEEFRGDIENFYNACQICPPDYVDKLKTGTIDEEVVKFFVEEIEEFYFPDKLLEMLQHIGFMVKYGWDKWVEVAEKYKKDNEK